MQKYIYFESLSRMVNRLLKFAVWISKITKNVF